MQTIPENRIAPTLAPNSNPLPFVPRPTRTELPRQALIEQIEALSDTKTLALIAPSGFGKSTVLAQYARTSNRPTIWLHLEPDDADPPTLLEHFLGKLPEQVTSAALGVGDPSVERVFWRLAQAFNAQTDHFNFVFDEINHLGLEARRAIQRFIDAVTEGHRVFLSGYDLEHLQLARAVAEGNAAVLGSQELAFSSEETSDYLTARGFAGDANRAHALLAGWPAGLALLAASSSVHVSPANLVSDALNCLPGSLRKRIPEATVLDVWCEDSLRAIGAELPPGWLLEVQRAGLPIAPLGDGRFQPHQVLLEALERELRGSPKRHKALHLRAGRTAEQQGLFLRAIQHFQAASADDELRRALNACCNKLIERGRFHLLRDTLEALPVERLEPHIVFHLAHCHLENGSIARAEALLHQLEQQQGDRVGLCYMRCLVAVRRGEYEAVLELCARADRLGNPQENQAFDRFRAVAYASLGQHAAAASAIERAFHWAETRNNAHDLAVICTAAQFVYFAVADVERRQYYLKRGIELFRNLDKPFQMLELYNDLADLHRQQGRFSDALALIDQAMEIANYEPNAMNALLLEVRADVQFFQGDLREAITSYGQALGVARSFGVKAIAVRIGLKLSEAYEQIEDRQQAETIMAQARANVDASTSWLKSFISFRLAQRALADHRDGEAEQHLLETLTDTLEPGHRVRGQAYLIELARREGKLTAIGVEKLFEAIDAVGSDSALKPDLRLLRPLIAVCRNNGWSTARWQRVLEHLEPQVPEFFSAPTTPEARIVLQIHSLGDLQVKFNGRVIRFPFAKAGELLVWLALNAPATRDQVLDALWETADLKRNIEYFKLSVRRLRSCLNEQGGLELNPVPFQDGLYRLARDVVVDVDVQKLLAMNRETTPEELERLFTAYQGPFVRQFGGAWAETLRSDAHEHILQVGLRLGALRLATDAIGALEVYKRLICLDPLLEQAHLGAMEAALKAKDSIAAHGLYRNYTKMLREEFGTLPEATLTARFVADQTGV
jgi:LuxR family transcriptional regulator, maltose regulon positive regulatory protein